MRLRAALLLITAFCCHVAAASGSTLPDAERVVLDNGTVLILNHKADVPMVGIHAVLRGGAAVFGEEIGHSVARQWLSSRIAEDHTVVRRPGADVLNRLGRFFPQRAYPIAAPFAVKTDLSRSDQAQINHADRQGFADSRAGVVQEEQDRMVPNTRVRASIRLGEERAHFFGFEIAGARGRVPLGGNCQHAVVLLDPGGVAAKQVPKERPDCRQPAVACDLPVLANLFQVPQEPYDLVDLEIVELQLVNRPSLAQKGEEELERITIGPNGVRAGRPDALQVSAEEGFNEGWKRIVRLSVHGPSVARSRERRRRPASSSSSGVAWR